MPVPAIVLAAGASSRLGRPKQLVIVGGETLLARTIRLLAEAGAAPIIAVLGAHFATISASIPAEIAVLVNNEQWEQGISTSIHAGLQAVAPQAVGVLLVTCDQLHLTAAHLRALIGAFEVHGASSIAASRYAGVDAVPAIFPRGVFPALLALKGDKGARSLLADPPCPVISVEFEGGEIDIDLPSDLAQLS